MTPKGKAGILSAWVVAVMVLGAAAGVACGQGPEETAATKAITEQAARALDLSPAVFVENKGQWDERIRYGFDGKGVRVSFTDAGPVFQMLGATGDKEQQETAQAVFSATFAGATQVRPVALEQASAQVNYYIGSDPAKWRPGVASYKKIVYKGLYDGIDLYTWGKRCGLKYEFHVAPGADWRQVVVRYDGTEKLSIDGKGALHIRTALGEMVDDAPVVYQEAASGRHEIQSRFRLVGETAYGFEVTDSVDAGLPLVLDPNLDWGSYLGGSAQEWGLAITCDSTGNAYVAGWTQSQDFPAAGGFITSRPGGEFDGFVAKVTPKGALEWASYLGGTDVDVCSGIACDSTGDAWVTGSTSSADFPTVGGFQGYGGNGLEDVFVARITRGGALAWASYLGGSNNEEGFAITCDSTGDAWVTGWTGSADFPVPGGSPYSSAYDDAFAARITPGGALVWATCLGGSGEERGNGIACDSTGNAWVAGGTTSTDFPTPGGFSTELRGDGDAFVAKITPSGTVAWASYLGGSGAEHVYGTRGISCDSTGNAWVVGRTESVDFPTPGGFSTTLRGAGDAFVARIAPHGELVWASYLGGDDGDAGAGVSCDSSGNAWVTGETQSLDFPTLRGFKTTLDSVDGHDGFVAEITPYGTLAWGSYLGGSGGDFCEGIACDSSDSIWVTGVTGATDFPTPGGFQVTMAGGGNDAFIVRIGGLRIATGWLPAGVVGVPYSQTLATANGTAPYRWSIVSGSLPPGLSLDSATGKISGTPTMAGTWDFTAQLVDSGYPAQKTRMALSMTIAPGGPTYHFAASDSETSTTSTSYHGKVACTFTPPFADDWIIFGFCEFRCPNVNYATFVQLFVDGVGEGQNTRKPVDSMDYLPFISVKVKNLSAAPHTIRIMYRAGSPAAAAYIRNARICAVRKAGLEFYSVANDNAKALTISNADIAVLRWTPAAVGNYLVVSTAELNATTTVSTDLQTLYNGVVNDEGIMRAADNGDYTTFMSFNYCANAPTGIAITHKITGRKMAADPVNHYIRRARILAIRLSNGRFSGTAAGSGTQQTTTRTAWTQCLTTTWTYGANGNWLLLDSARLNNSSTNYQTEVRVQLNNGPICGQQLMRPKHTTDLLNYSSIDVRALTTTRKVDMDFRTTNAAGTAMVKRLRFYGLPLDAQ